MTDRGATPVETLLRACEIGTAEGLRYVYAGNLPGRVGELGEHALPACGETLIERRGFRVLANRLRGGACPRCAAPIPGRWDARVEGTTRTHGIPLPVLCPRKRPFPPTTGRPDRPSSPRGWRGSMSVSWTRDAAAHLYRRAGFGGTPSEIDASTRGVSTARSRASWTTTRSTCRRTRRGSRHGATTSCACTGLQQWFLDRMAFSPRPLEEKLTYFWNLHWTSGISKVKGETLILNQNADRAAVRDRQVRRPGSSRSRRTRPCSIWLDNATNRAGRPNENYARELMELFTLGIGQLQPDRRHRGRARPHGVDGPGLRPVVELQRRDLRGSTRITRRRRRRRFSGRPATGTGTTRIGIILDLTDSRRLRLRPVHRREAVVVPGRHGRVRRGRRRAPERVRLVGSLDSRGRAGDPPSRRVLGR